MKSKLPGAFCFLAAITCFSQNQFTVSRYIKDVSNGEALIGTKVLLKKSPIEITYCDITKSYTDICKLFLPKTLL